MLDARCLLCMTHLDLTLLGTKRTSDGREGSLAVGLDWMGWMGGLLMADK